MSTEALVRTQIVAAIQGIAVSQLGLPDTSNIYEYLREYYHPEQQGDYLSAEIAGAMTSRAWGVQVLAAEESLALDIGGVSYSRLYQVTIRGYYSLVIGSDVNTLIDHARKVRGAIKALGIRLNNQVTLLESITPISPSIDNYEGGRLVVGDIGYSYLDLNPTF